MQADEVSALQDPTGWSLRLDPLAAAYRKSGAWHDETIWQAAWALAEREPDRPTHIFEGEQCAAAEITAEAARLGHALASLGYGPGDVVAFQLPNWREALIIDLACARNGLVVVPIIPIYRHAELRYMLADCGARALFVPGSPLRGCDHLEMARELQKELPSLEHAISVRGEGRADFTYAELVEEGISPNAPPVVDAGSVKMVLYTSGTTGKPKAVLHSHNTVACVVREAYARWGHGLGDTMLMASPVTHITGFSALEIPYLVGMRSVFMEAWNAAEAIRLVKQYDVTISIGATPFLKELLDEASQQGDRLASLRHFACGGAEVPPDLIHRAWVELASCRAFRVYGSSEAPLVTLGFSRPGERKLAAETDGAVGIYDVAIADDKGAYLAPGQDGEICVRGPALFLGYRDEEQTCESFDEQGYFRTGDIGRVLDGQALLVTGRKKDLINRGGEKISAKEVEDVLHRHPAVREAAVVASPHRRLGECVCACVIPVSGATPRLEELVAHCRTTGIARQKHPERLVLMPDFPRTPSGKIRKDVLRQDPQVQEEVAGT